MMRFLLKTSTFLWVITASPELSARAELVHGLHHCDNVFHRSFGKDAVAEVKDVSWPPAGALQDIFNPGANLRRWGEERNWIEVSLYPDVVSHTPPALVQVHSPVQTNDVSSSR